MIKMISKKQFYRLSLFWSILMGCLAFEWLIFIFIGMAVDFAEFGYYHGGLIILIISIIPHIVIWILGMIVLLILYLVEI